MDEDLEGAVRDERGVYAKEPIGSTRIRLLYDYRVGVYFPIKGDRVEPNEGSVVIAHRAAIFSRSVGSL